LIGPPELVVIVRFLCPACEQPARARLDQAHDWQCPHCDHRLQLPAADPALPACAVCGNRQLYKEKDFPHWLGMTILVGACVASAFTYAWYEKWLTWAILLGSAAFDGLLYFLVGDAVVCYRCHARYRRLTPTDAHQPFELTVGERYRQEQLRREQLKAGGER
jgi:DNA-directed RNA polymerase subunit RPC12/RpoP